MRVLLCLAFCAAGTLHAQEPRYASGNWDPDSLGNQRAVVQVRQPAAAVRVTIPWRRRDTLPEARDIVVLAVTTGRSMRVARGSLTREAGTLAFEPADGPGEYDVYYLRYAGSVKANYPRVFYPRPAPPDSAWLRSLGFDANGSGWRGLPEAELVEIQVAGEWNRVEPMELIAGEAETSTLLAAHPGSRMLLFPEDRDHPIRMTRDLPHRWILAGANGPVRATAQRGEYLTFQVGVYAVAALDSLSVRLTALRTSAGAVITAGASTCFNLGGVDWEGHRFTTRVDVAKGRVQALWFGTQVPDSAPPGRYEGTVTIGARNQPAVTLPVLLTVTAGSIASHGDDEPARLSRLRWLNSRLHQDDAVVRPFTPVRVAGPRLSILGRDVVLGAVGFPSGIRSFFTPELTGIGRTGREVLRGPVALVAADPTGRTLPWRTSGVRYGRRGEGTVRWTAHSTAGALSLRVSGTLEADGNMEYQVRLTAARETALGDVRLEIPFDSAAARYLMGLGQKGGARPAPFEWRWYQQANQDAAWIGDVNAGLQFTLKDQHYVRPLNTNFYQLKPLVLPESWYNLGHGGCRFTLEGPVYLVRCFSGARTMAAGESLYFNFRLAITPFRPIMPAAQFSTRFYHAYTSLDTVAAAGANVINVHHATAINPWINYPFLTPDTMRAYIAAAHQRGMRVKLYYTVRELTTRAPELWALRSLGHEVYAPGPGGGYSWLQEHLGEDYIAAWFVPELKDAAIVTSGVSRWHNFYVEGLDWLARNVEMDGIYIDDVAFDRTTMKRVRKALDRHRPAALIDLHSANQYNPNDGWASSANLYLEHFPYLDRIWFGEYFDYDSPPDYWLVEMSGIPFGVMGEMLEGGGNPWRGMLFGMTNRLPWAGDPRPIWREWDAFGIAEARMEGWWSPSTPVQTGRSDVLATSYVREGRTLVAIASWAPDTARVTLQVDWKRLGLDSSRVTLIAPEIATFQPAATFRLGQAIPVPPGKGWLLELRERK
ncbi:MAG: glycoside hydrolase domain-containing protein [Gemmatimonadota bacterium]